MNSFGQQYMPAPNNYMPQDPTAMYQQRLNNMAQQVVNQGQPGNNMGFNMQPQMQNPLAAMGAMFGGAQQAQSFNVRIVSGREEAMASQTPLDGSILIMIDRTHDAIYTKQLNMNDGTPLVKTYPHDESKVPVAAPVDNSVEYVKKSEFDELKVRFDEVWGALTKPEQAKEAPAEKKEGKK